MKKMKMMRTTRFVGGILSILLVLSMLFGSVAMMSMPGFAAESESNPGDDEPKENTFVPGTATTLPDGATVWDGVKSTVLEGEGTEASPYLIKTMGDFMLFRDDMAAAATADTYVEITNDLYFNGDVYTNKLTSVAGKNFAGHLDGKNHTIYNISYQGSNYSSMAMFNTVTGTIENLIVRGAYFRSLNSSAAVFAQILGGGAVIRNCKSLDVSLYAKNVAGIAVEISHSTEASVIIEDCEVSGYLECTEGNQNGQAGGILAAAGHLAGDAEISNCVNRATMIVKIAAAVGGISGRCNNGNGLYLSPLKITNCRNEGDITSTYTGSLDSYTAGIHGQGYRVKNLTLTGCVNTGNITVAGGVSSSGNGGASGILGSVSDGGGSGSSTSITDCVNHGNIVGTDNVGGMVANTNNGSRGNITLVNCANYGNISGANYVGGMVGKSDGGSAWSSAEVLCKNAANYGDVTASGNYAGGFGGFTKMPSSSNTNLYGFVQTGNVTAANYASAVYGRMRNCADKTLGSTRLLLENSIIDCTVKVTTVNGQVATLVASISGVSNTENSVTLSLTNCVFNIDVYTMEEVADSTPVETKVAAPYTKYTIGNVGETVALTSQENILTSGAGVTLLNNFVATDTDTYTRWIQGEYYPVFYTPSFSINNTVSLDREYDGKPSTVANLYAIKLEGTEVTVEWYDVSNKANPILLDEAPTKVGSYQVKLTPRLGDNIIDADIKTIDFAIKLATTTVELVIPDGYVLNQTTLTGAYNKDVTFTNETIEGLVKVKGTALAEVKPTVTISVGGVGTTAQNPGEYTITLAYAGDENYAASSMTYNMVIDKITVTYPENVWLRPDGTVIANQGGLKYTGSEQAVTLQFDETIFEVTYQNNTLTNVSADDAYQTATAEVTLSEDVETWYKFAEGAEPPKYTLTFRMDKGEVVLKLLDAQDKTVELNNMVYDGTTKTFTVAVYDARGTLLARIGTITVSDAKKYEESFVYAGTTQYLGGSLLVEFVVSPVKVNITQESLDKTYDKNAVLPNPQFTDNSYSNTETYTWNDYVYVWQKLQTGAGGTYEDIEGAPADAGTYKLTITRLTTDGNYEVNHEVDFVISRANPTINPDWDAFEAVSDGNGNFVYHITYSGNSLVIKPNTDSDGDVTITYNGSTSSPNAAGDYEVIVSIAESNNYNALAEQTYKICIDKLKIEIPKDTNALWDYSAPFTYDGTAHSVSLTQAFMDKYKEFLNAPEYLNNEQTAAAMEIIASVTLTRKNDSLEFSSDPSADRITISLNWVINKANPDISGITYNGIGGSDKTNVTVNYNGKEQSVVVGNLPDYLEVVGTIPGYTDVDTYSFDITFALKASEEANYNKPSTPLKDSLTFKIIQTAVTIEITGQNTFVYDNEEKTFTATVKDAAGNTYKDEDVILTITKDGITVTPANVKTVGEYLFTYELNNSNLIGNTASAVLTINKATYNPSDYAVTAPTVKYDGKGHTVTTSFRAGLDGVTIEMINTPGTYTEPGVYKITIQLRGSDNYNPISDLEVTLTILKADEAREDDQVKVEFQDGVDPTLNFEIVDADKTIVNTREVFGENYSVKELLNFVLTDEQGEAVKANGAVTVTIVVPEKYRDGVTLSSFVQLVPKKDGTYTVRTFDQAKRTLNASYDETTGVCTFNITDLSATYGYATEDNLLPQFILLGVAGVAIVGAIAVTVIRCKRAKRKEYEEE